MNVKLIKVIPDKENTYRIVAHINDIRFESIYVLTKERIIKDFNLSKQQTINLGL